MKIFALAAMLIAVAVAGSAAPACTGGVNVVTLNAGGGCTIGGLLFNNFTVLNASGGTGIAEVDLTNPTVVGNDIDLNFNPNLGLATEGNTITDLHFAFTVTGPLLGADLNVGGNNAAVSEQICSVAMGINGGCLTANLLFNAVALSGQAGSCFGNSSSGTYSASTCAFGAGVSQAWVFKNISINDPTTSHLTSFDETFLTSIPEPATLSMMGFGLVGLGLIARRRKK